MKSFKIGVALLVLFLSFSAFIPSGNCADRSYWFVNYLGVDMEGNRIEGMTTLQVERSFFPVYVVTEYLKNINDCKKIVIKNFIQIPKKSYEITPNKNMTTIE
jgi:hypothetical protein